MHTDFSARNATAVTPHDTNALNPIPNRLYVGGTGTVILRARGDGADTTFLGVPAGAILPVQAQYVRATGTTATGIIGLS